MPLEGKAVNGDSMNPRTYCDRFTKASTSILSASEDKRDTVPSSITEKHTKDMASSKSLEEVGEVSDQEGTQCTRTNMPGSILPKTAAEILCKKENSESKVNRGSDEPTKSLIKQKRKQTDKHTSDPSPPAITQVSAKRAKTEKEFNAKRLSSVSVHTNVTEKETSEKSAACNSKTTDGVEHRRKLSNKQMSDPSLITTTQTEHGINSKDSCVSVPMNVTKGGSSKISGSSNSKSAERPRPIATITSSHQIAALDRPKCLVPANNPNNMFPVLLIIQLLQQHSLLMVYPNGKVMNLEAVKSFLYNEVNYTARLITEDGYYLSVSEVVEVFTLSPIKICKKYNLMICHKYGIHPAEWAQWRHVYRMGRFSS